MFTRLLKLLSVMLWLGASLPAAHAQSAEQLLRHAIEQSPEVSKAKAGMQMAIADLKISKSAWLPQASARLYNGLGNTTQSNPLFNQNKGDENVQNNSISIQQNLYNKPASIQIQQGELALQEAELRHAVAIQTTIQNWMGKLIECKQTQVALELAVQQLDTALLKRQQVEHSLKNGESSALELANAQSELAVRHAEHAETQHALAQKLWEISQLTGKTIEADWIERIEFTQPQAPSPAETEQHVVEHNPNLKIQQLYTDIAELEINKAKSQHQPTVRLVAQNTQSKSETASTLGNRVKQNVLAVQMDVPLFNGFASQGQTEKAVAGLSKQQADYDNTKNATLREAWAAKRQLTSAIELLKAYDLAIEAARQSQQAVETGLKHQLAIPLDMAQAKVKLAELEMKQMDYLLTANKAHLKMLELMGSLNEKNALNGIFDEKK